MLRTRVLRDAAAFGALEGAWNELAGADLEATPFQTWDWQDAWWRAFGRGKSLYVLAVEEGRDLVGLYPLFLRYGPWRVLRPIGVGPSDYLQPLARAELRQGVAECIREHLIEGHGFDLVDIHQLRETQPLAAFGGRPQAVSLVLDLPPTFDA